MAIFDWFYVVAGSAQVFLDAERHLDALLLVGLKHVVEHLVDRKQKTYGKYCRTGGDENLALRYAQSLKQNVAYGCADYLSERIPDRESPHRRQRAAMPECR